MSGTSVTPELHFYLLWRLWCHEMTMWEGKKWKTPRACLQVASSLTLLLLAGPAGDVAGLFLLKSALHLSPSSQGSGS